MKIKAIYGMEPGREGEYPTVHMVGSESYSPDAVQAARFRCDRIERREENFGDHGLVWYDVFEGDTVRTSMQGRAVAEVHYEAVGV